MEGFNTSFYRWSILLLSTPNQVGIWSLQQAPAALESVLIEDLDLTRSQVGFLSPCYLKTRP